jgi:3-methyladenine DNA glycosylase/8-oxoguanine DNA glycosylase
VPDWPCPIGPILGTLRHGAGDPTYTVTPDGAIWRAVTTPDGPATVRIIASGQRIEAEAWGDGADWALASLPAMLGAEDDPTGFVPVHDVLITAQRQRPHLRVPRTRRVWEALVPAVLEQKVTGKQASGSFRSLLRQYGDPAPGPELGLRLIPSPEVVAQIPSWAWLKMQVEPAASRTLVNAAARATALERTLDLDSEAADRALRSLPGIGVWTSAEVRARAHGDPDAISFGDFHIAKDIGYALTGEAADDAGLERLLEPYLGHRLRVQMLLAGIHRPRRGPRMSVPTHLPR